MNILMVGDIVGSPGRKAFARGLEELRRETKIDLVVANAENSAGGRGLTPPLAEEIFKSGADVITLGDHVWDQKEMLPWMDRDERLLRPANLPPACPGRGWVTIDRGGVRITIINLLGRVFMQPADCPFRAADALLSAERPGSGGIVIVDIHAEATSEKIAMGRYLAGRVTAVAGTHTHVQTSDERILRGGTAYLTDLGMTGPRESVLGRDYPSVLHKFLTGMPSAFKVARGPTVMEGLLVEADPRTGLAAGLRRVRLVDGETGEETRQGR